MHVFVDESHRDRYRISAALVSPADLDETRTQLRGLCLQGQHRIHFNSESDRRRKKIISGLLERTPAVWIFEARGPQERAREACLIELVGELPGWAAQQLVLETRGQQRDLADRRIIRQTLAKNDIAMTYHHLEARQEPLLWIADIVGWAHGAGGHWAHRVRPMIAGTVTVP